MKENNVIALEKPGQDERDALTEVLRQGAWRMLAQTVEAEVEAFVAVHEHIRDEEGRRLVIRNGYLPERTIQTGIGDIAVKAPRVRDRSGLGIRFSSAILPPYLRRTKSIEELIPWLYLKGISTGDFSEALGALLGPDAPGLSAATVSRLKEVWKGELEAWQRRDLTGKRYVYFWVDGIYFQARLEQAKQCFLVIIGADEAGNKELVGLWDGFRESEQSWMELLLDLKSRGLEMGPKLATGDGALGFWNALSKAYGQTRQQRFGCTRRPMCSTSCPKACKSRPSSAFTKSGWRKTGKKPRRLSIFSSTRIRPSIPRLRSAWTKIAALCWHFTTFRRSTGRTSAPPIPSNRPSQRYGCARPRPEAASPGRPPPPWSLS